VLVAAVMPHTILAEGSLAVCLVLTGYVIYLQGINPWASAVLVLSIVPFLLSLQAKRARLPLLGLAIVLMIGSSIFLFSAVNLMLAALVSLASGLSIWFCAERAAEAMRRRPLYNPDEVVGQSGEARTEIKAHGTVQAGGELWSARSEKPIEAGTAVRVLRREGFVLIVEKETN
jgi:membrane-bound serine protease (ClpP class)